MVLTAPPPLSSSPPLDGDLAQRARAGDRAAFQTLVERHQDRVYGLALRLLRDPGEAEEVVQEAFLAAFEKLPDFRGASAFGTWIFRIAANAALMRLRKRKRSPESVPGEAAIDELLPRFDEGGRLATASVPRHDWSKRADEQLADRQVREAIERAVENLPDESRIVFLLKDVDGLSGEAIGELLGLSVPAVKSRLHRARLALRRALEDVFGER